MAVSRRTRDAAHYQAIVREDDFYKALAQLSLANRGIKNPNALQLKLEVLVLTHYQPRPSVFFAGISEQEKNYLFLAACGLEIEETAELLEVHPDSVAKARCRIFQKLHAKNMTHAVVKATQAGLLNFANADLLIHKLRKCPQAALELEAILEEDITENAQ